VYCHGWDDERAPVAVGREGSTSNDALWRSPTAASLSSFDGGNTLRGGEGAQGPGTTLRGAAMHERLGKVPEGRLGGDVRSETAAWRNGTRSTPPPCALFTMLK